MEASGSPPTETYVSSTFHAVWSALDLQSPETTVKLRFFGKKQTKTNYVVGKVW